MELQELEVSLQSALEKAPEGTVHVIQSRNHAQFYMRESKATAGGTYIQKSEKRKIKTYLQKSYFTKLQKAVKSEIKGLEQLLKVAEPAEKQIKSLYSNYHPEIKQYLDPIDMSDAEFVEKWIAIPFVTKGIEEGNKTYNTDRGEIVRSKSELTIANRLYHMGIPYKYECPLKLKTGQVIYPDFTVLNINTRREMYWEHRGMMDDEEYASGAVARMRLYRKNDCYIGENLIITEETSTHSLDTKELDHIIQKLKSR